MPLNKDTKPNEEKQKITKLLNEGIFTLKMSKKLCRDDGTKKKAIENKILEFKAKKKLCFLEMNVN